MGVFNDYRLTCREGWKYTYTGSQLLAHVRQKYFEVKAREMRARNTLADLLRNPLIGPEDQRVVDNKRFAEKWGSEAEQLMVFCHEFAREPDREYTLGLGDVTYFDLASPPKPTPESQDW